MNDANQELNSLITQVARPLSAKETGQLITRLDQQVQASNTQIFAPRLQELEKNRNDALTILGLDATATPRQIKLAFNDAAIKFHPDKTTQSQTDTFIKITEAYKFLTQNYPQQISNITNALEFQEKNLLKFEPKISIDRPLSEKQKELILQDKKDTQDLLDTASKMNEQAQEIQKETTNLEEIITAQELKMLDIQRQDKEATESNAKQRKQNSEALLINFQNQVRKITETTLEPSLQTISTILNPERNFWNKLRNADLTQEEKDTMVQEIQTKIIDPYQHAIKNLYNPTALSEIESEDQKALEKTYDKAMDAYKDSILKYLQIYKAKITDRPKLAEAIDEIANKLDLTQKQTLSHIFEWPTESNPVTTSSHSPYGSPENQMNYL